MLLHQMPNVLRRSGFHLESQPEVDLAAGMPPWQPRTAAMRKEPATFPSAEEEVRTLAQHFGKIASLWV